MLQWRTTTMKNALCTKYNGIDALLFLQVIFVGTESWCDGRKYFPINQFAVNFLVRISHDGVHFVRVY